MYYWQIRIKTEEIRQARLAVDPAQGDALSGAAK